MKLVLLLGLLYFLQGIPYGFQTKFLPIFLRSYSLSLTLISVTRVLSLPWLLKPLWAPLVDKFGAKTSWVKYNLFGMALCYLLASWMPLNKVSLTVLIVAGLNIMAATQDIAVDSLFVNHLASKEIGLGNIAQVVGYKTGSLFGGGFLGWLSSSYPWQWLFLFLFGLYVVSAFLVSSSSFINFTFPQPNVITEKTYINTEKHLLTMDKSCNLNHIQPNSNYINLSEKHKNENKSQPNVTGNKNKEHMEMNTVTRRKFQDTKQNEKCISNKHSLSQNSGNFIGEKFQEYLDVYRIVLNSEGTKWTIVYVLIYKLGEQGMIAIFPMFLLDQGMSPSDTAMVTGVLCQFCSILGSLLGGVLFSYWNGLCSTLAVLSTMRFLAVCMLSWFGSFNSLNPSWIIIVEGILHFVSGMITTLTFTAMVSCSQKCPRIHSATHYSTLATFEVLGKLCMVSVAGWLVDMIGYVMFFIICSFLSLLPVGLLSMANTSFQQEKVTIED